MIEQEQPSLSAMLDILPDPAQFISPDPNPDIDCDTMNDRALQEALKPLFPKLRDMAGNCPACIMAALRQKGIPVPACGDLFDFKKERDSFWSDVNS